ncbi:MAG: diphthine synthase, partial [Nanoarchaeota archaeon]|nr:diphthine synthase [Nanoarchaeota archaeon]
MLYLIGIGLGNEKSISVEGSEIIKKCDKVYLENYTSKINMKDNFEKVGREFVENFNVLEAKDKDVAFLIIGDVFSATTHISLFNEAKDNDVDVKVINNASILTAVGITGLILYNFGKVASIPFDNKNVEGPIRILNDNQMINTHTLFLLDLNPAENKYLSIKEGVKYLEKRGVNTKIIACARLGSKDFK